MGNTPTGSTRQYTAAVGWSYMGNADYPKKKRQRVKTPTMTLISGWRHGRVDCPARHVGMQQHMLGLCSPWSYGVWKTLAIRHISTKLRMAKDVDEALGCSEVNQLYNLKLEEDPGRIFDPKLSHPLDWSVSNLSRTFQDISNTDQVRTHISHICRPSSYTCLYHTYGQTKFDQVGSSCKPPDDPVGFLCFVSGLMVT